MQVQDLVGVLLRLIGSLVQNLTEGLASWGNVVSQQSTNEEVTKALTNGIFGTQDGLIYWASDELVYLLNHLLTGTFGHNLHDFLVNLLGSAS